MTKAQEFRDLSDVDLEDRYLDERKKLFNMINEKEASGGKQFDKPHRIRQAKREIARMLTIKREKQLAQRNVEKT
jgi:large subunit ribosomal protein L29